MGEKFEQLKGELEKNQSFEQNPISHNVTERIRAEMRASLDSLTQSSTNVELATFTGRFEESIDISAATGTFFRELIPRSLRPPDREKPYVHIAAESDLAELWQDAMEALRAARTGGDPAAYAELKAEILHDFDQEYVSEVIEHVQTDGTVVERRVTGSLQAGGKNMVEESVSNVLSAPGHPMPANCAFSELTVKNLVKQWRIELRQLLPNGYVFSPAALTRARAELAVNKDGEAYVKKTPEQVSLHSYNGPKGMIDGFAEVNAALSLDNEEQHEVKQVEYGDLTKPGGMVALLHEIAHAWQHEYYQDHGRYEFESLYASLKHEAGLLALIQKRYATGTIPEELYQDYYLPAVEQRFKEKGASINPASITYAGQSLGPDEYVFQYEGVDIVVSVPALEPLIAGYVRQERDAWAHALKVLRFLRQRGVDLEPEMDIVQTLEQRIHTCLSSYQKDLENLLQSPAVEKRFTRRSPS